VAQHLKAGSIVVYESTVYPGLTEEFCVPILEKVSGMVFGKDFFVGYSPERINPGDTEHVLEKITKVVSGSDAKTTERIASIYKAIIEAGIHIAPSIKVAEMAKVLENTQRDLNIALMNELAVICDKIGIRTADVLSAAKTKWNFLPFTPGLVGGHCIGVDPYYLTAKAESLGYHPQVILAGRRINDGVGPFIAQRLVRLLSNRPHALSEAKVAILGLSFKENISDIRNSRVPDIYQELRQFGIESFVCDPLADSKRVEHEYGIRLTPLESLQSLDAIVLAVPHTGFIEKLPTILGLLNKGGVLMDVKSAVPSSLVSPEISYWSL
jgi:UDP-N-acetyl-D-galactosamine dehydrogenase